MARRAARRTRKLGTIGKLFGGVPYYWWGSYSTKTEAKRVAVAERKAGHPSRVEKYGDVWAIWRRR